VFLKVWSRLLCEGFNLNLVFSAKKVKIVLQILTLSRCFSDLG